MYNMDIAGMRAIVTVVDHGGVGRAASILNLTQSAVSMQIKRLEDMLGKTIFLRESRKLLPTSEGEICLSYARRMLALHDEMFARMTYESLSGELVFGVPADLLSHVAQILHMFSKKHPAIKIQIVNENSYKLRQLFLDGKIDMMLTTTYDGPGEELLRVPLRWIGMQGGVAARIRPLKIALSNECAFRKIATQILDDNEIVWENSDLECEVANSFVLADLAVRVILDGRNVVGSEYIEPPILPKLPNFGIYYEHNLGQKEQIMNEFRQITKEVFSKLSQNN